MGPKGSHMGEHSLRASHSCGDGFEDIRPTIVVDLFVATMSDIGRNYPWLAADCRKAVKRCQAEGQSFILVVVPGVARYLDALLTQGGRVEPPSGATGRKLKDGSHACAIFPTFFAWLRAHLGTFSREQPFGLTDLTVIRDVRTALSLFKKTNVGKTYSTSEAVVLARAWASRVSTDPLLGSEDSLRRSAREEIFNLLIGHEQRLIIDAHQLCRHGPGVVVEKLRGNAKWDMRPTQRLCDAGLDSHLFLNQRHQDAEDVGPASGDGMTRMILVPKDFRGPRIISCEPAALMYLQQGMMRSLVRFLEEANVGIHFSEQEHNQRGALDASQRHYATYVSGADDTYTTQQFATVDMKDASDRVSYVLVRELFSSFPELWKYFDATRSTMSETPAGVIPLRCFAPMGSALCFPVEAMVFWAIARAVMREAGYTSFRSLHVYGDDIIIPSACVGAFDRACTSLGMQMNVAKTCFKTSFRESCGKEYFQGVDISTPRLNSLASKEAALPAIVALHNALPPQWGELRRELRRQVAHIGFPSVVTERDHEWDTVFTIYHGEDVMGCTPLRERSTIGSEGTVQQHQALVPVLGTKKIASATIGWGPVFAGIRSLAIDRDPLPGHVTVRMRWQTLKQV